MDTELAIKSEHLKQVKGQIEKLESDKGKIMDWVRAKEKEVDEANKRKAVVFEEISKAQKEIDSKKKIIDSEYGVIQEKQSKADQLIRSAQMKLDNSAIAEAKNLEYSKELNRVKDSLMEREVRIQKKEAYILSIFAGLEKLKNA